MTKKMITKKLNVEFDGIKLDRLLCKLSSLILEYGADAVFDSRVEYTHNDEYAQNFILYDVEETDEQYEIRCKQEEHAAGVVRVRELAQLKAMQEKYKGEI